MFARHAHYSAAGRGFSRRSFLRTASAVSLAAGGGLSFSDALAADADGLRKRGKAMILLWMAGAPSQFETFDPKPDHEYGGGTEAIDTAAAGIQIAQDWPNVAKAAGDIAFVRSMTNNEGNHQRASYQLHTGYAPTGSVRHPSVAAGVVQQIAPAGLALPASVTIGGRRDAGAGGGFLGVKYDPLTVPKAGAPPANVASNLPARRVRRRLGLLDQLEGEFAARGGGSVVANHRELV